MVEATIMKSRCPIEIDDAVDGEKSTTTPVTDKDDDWFDLDEN